MMRADARGFALIAVLLVLALLGIVGAEFAYSMRLEGSAVRTYRDNLIGTHLAEAAVEQATREIVQDFAYVGACKNDPLTFYGTDRAALKWLPRRDVPLGPGRFSYTIADEEARLNLNTSGSDRIDRLLQALGVGKSERDAIGDSIQDWRDANDEHRLNGAESDDTYLKLSVPYRARNGNITSMPELLQIKGITPAIFDGVAGRPGLAAVATVKSSGPVNINTASEYAMRALGLSEAEISQIVETRCEASYPIVPGQFGARGFSVTSRTFRIEAEGSLDGKVVTRLSALVQKRSVANRAPIAIVEWSGPR
jgi:general secretion pathway protein K